MIAQHLRFAIKSAQFAAKADLLCPVVNLFSSFQWFSCEASVAVNDTQGIHVSVDLCSVVLHAVIMFRGWS